MGNSLEDWLLSAHSSSHRKYSSVKLAGGMCLTKQGVTHIIDTSKCKSKDLKSVTNITKEMYTIQIIKQASSVMPTSGIYYCDEE